MSNSALKLLFQCLVLIAISLLTASMGVRGMEQDRETIYKLLNMLDGSGSVQEAEAKQALRQRGTNAIPEIIRMFSENQSRDSQLKAVLGCVAIGTNSLPILIEGLKSESPRFYLAQFGILTLGTNAILPLVSHLDNLPGKTRGRVLRTISYFRSDASFIIQDLIDCTFDESKDVLIAAIDALGAIGKRSDIVIPRLVEVLETDGLDREVKLSVIWALRSFGDRAKGAVPSLIIATKDADEELQEAAKYALDAVNKGGDQ